MQNQALLALKDERKKLKCRLLQFLFGVLTLKDVCASRFLLSEQLKERLRMLVQVICPTTL